MVVSMFFYITHYIPYINPIKAGVTGTLAAPAEKIAHRPGKEKVGKMAKAGYWDNHGNRSGCLL